MLQMTNYIGPWHISLHSQVSDIDILWHEDGCLQTHSDENT